VFGQGGAVAELLSCDWAESSGGGKEQYPLDNFKKSLHSTVINFMLVSLSVGQARIGFTHDFRSSLYLLN
jgi:hypothetical protein